MTYVINILHRDYSILMADLRAVKLDDNGNLITDQMGNIEMEEMHKISLRINNNMAVGISGVGDDHYYLKDLINAPNINDGLQRIDYFLKQQCGSHDHDQNGCATYFDSDTKLFHSKFFKWKIEAFKPNSSSSRIIIGKTFPEIIMFGSGARNMPRSMKRKIRKYFKYLTLENLNCKKLQLFATHLFNKLSVLDFPYVGSKFEIFLATKDAPEFKPLVTVTTELDKEFRILLNDPYLRID